DGSAIVGTRLSRRRAIAATGGGAAAAVLVGCGGGSSSSGSSGTGGGGGTTSKVAKAEDTTKQAKRGGTIKDRSTADPSTMDVQQPIAPLNFPARHIYSTLVAEKPGYLEPEKFELGPDLAESGEYSPDGLQITMK